VDGDSVIGTTLSTDQVLNFMLTEDVYTWGWAFGFTAMMANGCPVPDRTAR
jgi:hypothetical protein